MSTRTDKMKIGMFIRPCGHHIASWRHPEGHADAGANFARMIEIAQTAERGLIDMVFCADTHSVFTAHEQGLHRLHYVAWIEPFTMLAALASHTKNIGLVCTASTSFEQPYIVARKFASLDLVSGGRSGWNVVTSGNATEALNFSNEPHKPKDERYKRGTRIRRGGAGAVGFVGRRCLRARQGGVPVLRSGRRCTRSITTASFLTCAARSMCRARRRASRCWCRPAPPTTAASWRRRPRRSCSPRIRASSRAKAFYADLKGRMARYGRNPDHLKIMPGLSITVGRTHDEAVEKQEQLDELLHPDVGLSLLSTRIGHDLTGFPLDGPLPELPENKVIGSRSDVAIAMARSKNMTIRQLYQWFARQRGHAGFVGTPTEVVDQMEQWFNEGACDGFNFLAPVFPIGLNDFVDLVVPEMQRRGLYRTAYEGPTLRDILGLPMPQSRYARGSAARDKATA